MGLTNNSYLVLLHFKNDIVQAKGKVQYKINSEIRATHVNKKTMLTE